MSLSDDDDDEIPTLVNVERSSNANESLTTKSLPACPVTILSGFLGSGKTTLIQYILQSPDHGKRIAVIENEFGEGLSVESIIAKDGADQSSLSDLIELPNGCVCCTVKDSLVSTLENLLEKRQDLDYILIEASGMANPGPIASLFWLDENLDSRLRLDGIVTVVDAKHIEMQLKDTEEASQQIAYADRILLNKVDLVDSTVPMESAIRSVQPTAPIRATTFSQIPDLDWILDANCFDADRAKDVEKLVTSVDVDDNHHQHDHDHDHTEDCAECKAQQEHRHTSAVSTTAFQLPGSVDLAKINAWLAAVLWPNQDEQDKVLRARLENPSQQHVVSQQSSMQIFRIKGILSVYSNEEEDGFVDDNGLDRRRYIVQAVHDLWEVYPASKELAWDKNEERCCKLVVIGKYLDREELQQGFERCAKEL